LKAIVEVNRLTKSYGKEAAVNEVSFSLKEGKIYGLLGRNGAGKTTIMRMITAQLFPTSGELSVFGESPYENERVLNQVCFIKEAQKYPEWLRVGDVLRISASLFPNWDQEFADLLAQEFRLPLKKRMKKLSRGMLSSVGIIVGLASRAPLTIFDEPYLGLDAVARSLFYDRLIEDYSVHPRTIVLSTHLIDEVSRLLEHVIIIDRGQIILDEDTDTLRSGAYSAVGSAVKLEAFVSGKKVIHRETFGGLGSVTISGTLSADMCKQAEEQGIEIGPVSLQQLMVNLTGGNSERKAADGR